MEHNSQHVPSTSTDAVSDQRHRRAETLLNAKRTLELAEKLKLVSLNVAIESAKTRGGAFEVQRLKQELSDLTNQAVKASKEISELISTINRDPEDRKDGPASSLAGRSHQDSSVVEFRKAVRLRKDLDELLAQCKDALDRIDRIAPGPFNPKKDTTET